MRMINLPTRETSREYLARIKREKEEAAKKHQRWLIKKPSEGTCIALLAAGVMLFGFLLYAVFVPVKP